MFLSGNTLSILAFILWGLIPLYFQFIPDANIIELLAIRVIIAIPLMLLLIKFVSKNLQKVLPALKNKKILFMCFLAGGVNCLSLYSMTWALTNGHVLAVSLGYFINPIFSIILGVLFFKDRLSLAQKIAVFLSICGISYQVGFYGELPWLSLIMGSAFALYGLIKKYILLDPLTATLIELICLIPIAVMAIIMGIINQQSALYLHDWDTLMWYIGAVPVTLIPLILFSMAVGRTSLTMIGLTQYIEPSLQFLLAILVFGELLAQVKLISFSCIWLGLVLCTLEAFVQKRKMHWRTKNAPAP